MQQKYCNCAGGSMNTHELSAALAEHNIHIKPENIWANVRRRGFEPSVENHKYFLPPETAQKYIATQVEHVKSGMAGKTRGKAIRFSESLTKRSTLEQKHKRLRENIARIRMKWHHENRYD